MAAAAVAGAVRDDRPDDVGHGVGRRPGGDVLVSTAAAPTDRGEDGQRGHDRSGATGMPVAVRARDGMVGLLSAPTGSDDLLTPPTIQRVFTVVLCPSIRSCRRIWVEGGRAAVDGTV